MRFTPENISRTARVAAIGAVALGTGLIDRVVPNSPIKINTPTAEAACSGPDCDDTRTPSKDNCEREARVAYLAGARRPGEPVIASLTGRKADVVIGGADLLRLRVGDSNNSATADNEYTARYQRSLMIGGIELNYIAVPVGKRESIDVRIHRLNIDGSRRYDEASNPPSKIVDTCVVCGGPDMDTHEGLQTIQVFVQDSELGDKPGQYKNEKRDLRFQSPDKFFQDAELAYLLK